VVQMNPAMARAGSLTMVFAALALPFPATASSSLNCFGPASGKTVLQVHAILDCKLEDDSIGWCDIDVKVNEQWLNLPRTLRSVTSPGVFPEAPDDLVGAMVLKPPVTVLEVLDEDKKVVLKLTLEKVTATDAGAVFMGRATVSWKGHRIKDAAVRCDEPG
jgi:hypothetical protein